MRTIQIFAMCAAIVSAATLRAQETTASYSASVTATIEFKGGAASTKESNSVSFTIRDTALRQLYSIERVVPFDHPRPGIFLFDDGAAMITYPFDGELEFVDRRGNSLTRVRIPSAVGVDHERAIRVAVHAERMALLVSETAHEQSVLYYLTPAGVVAPLCTLEYEQAQALAISNDGKTIAASALTWKRGVPTEKTWFVSRAGVVLRSVDEGFHNGAFTKNDSFFLGTTSRRGILIDVAHGELLWKVAPANKRMFLRGGFIQQRPFIIEAAHPYVITGKYVYRDARLLTYSATGAMLSRNFILRGPFEEYSLDTRGATPVFKADKRRIQLR